MRYQIALFILALLTVGAFSKNVRIVGGVDVDVRTYPFLALFKHVGYAYCFCGGAIISNKHILTTAKCMRKQLNNLANVRVYTGVTSSEANSGTAHEIDQVFIHPAFTAQRNPDEMFLHDISVVKLKEAIQLNQYQNVIELLNRDVTGNDDGFVLGWGSTSYPTLSYPLQMQRADIHLVPDNMNSIFFNFLVHDTQFMALDKIGVGPCTGDGGDPFIIDGKLAGLTSIIYRCARGVPDIYTKIYYYIDFITDMKNL